MRFSWAAEDEAYLNRPEFDPGHRIGSYELQELLGRGGMGSVYRAFDETGREVALKLSHPSADLGGRLRREGEVLAQLSHPGILELYDSGHDAGREFLVLQLVPGARSLEDLLSSASREALLNHVLNVAQALGHAHQAGIVHRDVKAENLLVDSSGRVFVTDFGLGCGESLARLTQTGALVGTPYAMAPEQIAADPPTAKSDVWALGVLLYRVLTQGRLPFPGPTLEELATQIAKARYAPLSGEVPAVSPALQALCRRCMSADPDQRPTDGEAMAQELRSALGAGSSSPHTPTRLQETVAVVPAGLQEPACLQETVAVPPAADSPRHAASVRQSLFSPPLGDSLASDSARFRLLALVGEGAMGSVHRAWDTTLKREVAIKFLTPRTARARQRFLLEAQALARVRHPSVVPIHEVGAEGSTAFIVMELVEGVSLRERLHKGALEPREAAHVALHLAKGLGAAHAAGLVHRDVKPANVFLTPEGKALLGDFGAVLDLEEHERLTRSGCVVGTPYFFSPEQAGLKREITPASDVFSLGSLFYESLTGELPFPGGSLLELVAQVTAASPDPPRRLEPKIPRGLEAIVLRCLRAKPQDRYADGAELATAIEEWLSGADDSYPRRKARMAAVTLGLTCLGVAAYATFGAGSGSSHPPAPSTSDSSTSSPSSPTLPDSPPAHDAPHPSDPEAFPQEVVLSMPTSSKRARSRVCWDGRDVLALNDRACLVRWKAKGQGEFEGPRVEARLTTSLVLPPRILGGPRGPFGHKKLPLQWLVEGRPVLHSPTILPFRGTFSLDGRLLATSAVGTHDGALVSLVDLRSRQRVAKWQLDPLWYATSLCFDRAGRTLTLIARKKINGRQTGDAARFYRWDRDPKGWVPSVHLPGFTATRIHRGLEGEFVISTSLERLYVINQDYEKLGELRPPRQESQAALSPQAGGSCLGSRAGLLISLASGTSEIRWWNLKTQESLSCGTLLGQCGRGSFSPDGRRVAFATAGRVQVIRAPRFD